MTRVCRKHSRRRPPERLQLLVCVWTARNADVNLSELLLAMGAKRKSSAAPAARRGIAARKKKNKIPGINRADLASVGEQARHPESFRAYS